MATEWSAPHPAGIAAAAERLMAMAWGGPVRLGETARLRGTFDRSTVLRCPVADAPGDAPPSVIVKCFRGDCPPDDDAWPDARRLATEWAAYTFLRDAPGTPLSARLYGGDEAAVLMLEDMGDGPALADLLLGDDPTAAEAGLLAYAAGVGRLHAATPGRMGEYDRLRAAHGLPAGTGEVPAAGDAWSGRLLAEQVGRVWAGCAAVGVAPPAAAEAEAARLADFVAAPGPWRAFSPGDTCPNNHRLTPTGPRFFDFEFSSAGHALLDASYLRLPFPTCIHVGRLPAGLTARAEVAYRAALAQVCPVAADDAAWGAALTSAYWTLVTLGWHLSAALAADDTCGIATLRQRHRLRLETFITTCDEFGHLPALAALAHALACRLRNLWPEAEMPPFPTFRTTMDAEG